MTPMGIHSTLVGYREIEIFGHSLQQWTNTQENI